MQNYFSIQFLWVVKSLWLTSKKIPLSMRLLVLFLVCSIGLSYAADSYAQKAMISIDVHNQRVEDILKEIEAQSDFDFFLPCLRFLDASSCLVFGCLDCSPSEDEASVTALRSGTSNPRKSKFSCVRSSLLIVPPFRCAFMANIR